jgi:hypothetical protein
MKKTRLLEIIQEEIALALREGEAEDKAAKSAQLKAIDLEIKALQKKKQDTMRSGVSEIALEEDQLDEMAKITGRLESAIKKVLAANSDLEGLPLKKAIKADKEVEDALEGDTMYDNQLNKFIALVRGEREVGPRGRKADPTKAKVEPKAKAEPKSKAEPKAKAEKASTKDMDDEDKEATASIGKDETAKELGKTAPKDKIEKFNLGLKFIKKYKDDKAKIDAYLKKAKEEYKFSTAMMKDLKKTAGRDVSI